MNMKEIAREYLKKDHDAAGTSVHGFPDQECEALHRFVYHGGIWDAHARKKYPVIRLKKPSEWTLDDIYAYLTFIVLTERTQEGCFEAHIKDGTINRLLERYLELEGEN